MLCADRQRANGKRCEPGASLPLQAHYSMRKYSFTIKVIFFRIFWRANEILFCCYVITIGALLTRRCGAHRREIKSLQMEAGMP